MIPVIAIEVFAAACAAYLVLAALTGVVQGVWKGLRYRRN